MKALYGEGLHPEADRIIAEAQASGASARQAQAAAKLGRGFYSYDQNSMSLRDAITEGYARFERTEHREPTKEERRAIRNREGAQAFREVKGRPPADKEELGRYITAATRPKQQAVAGFDLVFSPAKSVSTLRGLGDNEARQTIEGAHEQAIADTVKYLEDEAIATRAGTNGVAQIDVQGGLIATRFRHYDSRTGDPQLHDHLVVANKVKGSDGKWRTIDSKLLHRQGVAASEFYNARVMDLVTERLGVTTELREVAKGKRPVVEVAHDHDFYVAATNSSILVHNCGEGGEGSKGRQRYFNNSQMKDLAKRLGFRPTNDLSLGEKVFTNGKTYITQDRTSDINGVFKQAKSVADLASKDTRMGTYDVDLNKIGDRTRGRLRRLLVDRHSGPN